MRLDAKSNEVAKGTIPNKDGDGNRLSTLQIILDKRVVFVSWYIRASCFVRLVLRVAAVAVFVFGGQQFTGGETKGLRSAHLQLCMKELGHYS